MTKRRAAPPPAYPRDEFFDADETLDAALERVVSELGGDDDVSINVYRIAKGERQEGFVESYPPSEFEGEISFLKRLRDEHGAGDYRIQIRDGEKFRVNRRVRIEGGPKLDKPAASPDLAAVIEGAFKRIEQLLTAARPQETEEVWLRRLAMMRQVLMPAASGTNISDTVKQLFETFQQGLNLGRELSGAVGASAEDVLLETVKTFGPELVKQVKRIETTAAPKAMNHQVARFLDVLVTAAQADADRALYAELVYDQLGPEAVQKLFAQAADPVDALVKLDSRVGQYRPWFSELRDVLKGIATDESALNAAAAAGGAGGDSPHASGDEGADAQGA